jgi:hypothetical protein
MMAEAPPEADEADGAGGKNVEDVAEDDSPADQCASRILNPEIKLEDCQGDNEANSPRG